MGQGPHTGGERERFLRKWESLIDAIIDGNVVPFLGAGVSVGAEFLNEQGKPAGKMERTVELVKRCHSLLKSEYPGHILLDLLQKDLQRGGQPPRPPQLYEIAALHFDLKNEPSFFDEGAPFSCDLFCRIVPNLGHRCVAWLAREGLVSEVITTNYDTATEQAYWNSFGMARDRVAREEVRRRHDPAYPVSDHLEYRELGGRTHVTHPRLGRLPVLNLYKINGCAEGWIIRRNKGRCTDAYLIITERHLQDFGSRKWAADLLRDRIRSRQILFVGFGAEEPQVRFTALQVVEEFASSRLRENNAEKPSRPLHQDDFPQIFAQEYQQHPSNFINQIMRAALGSDRYQQDPHQSVFSGAEAAWMHGLDANHLTADDFFHRVWLSCLKRILVASLGGTVAAVRLAAHGFPAVVIQADLLRRLVQEPCGDDASSPEAWGETQDFRYLFEVPFGGKAKSRMQAGCRLMEWTRAIAGKSNDVAGFYAPLSDPNSLAVSLLLILHMVATAEEVSIRDWCEARDAGGDLPIYAGRDALWLRLSNPQPAWVAVSDADRTPRELPPWGNIPGHYIQLVLRDPLPMDPWPERLYTLYGVGDSLPSDRRALPHLSVLRMATTVDAVLSAAATLWQPWQDYAPVLVRTLCAAPAVPSLTRSLEPIP